MYLILLHMTGPMDDQPELAAVRSLLQSHIDSDDGIEHHSLREQPGRIDLALYLIADDEATAALTAHSLCRRAFASAILRGGWRLSDGWSSPIGAPSPTPEQE